MDIEQSGPKSPLYSPVQYQQSYSMNYICEHVSGIKKKQAFAIGFQKLTPNAKSSKPPYPILTPKRTGLRTDLPEPGINKFIPKFCGDFDQES